MGVGSFYRILYRYPFFEYSCRARGRIKEKKDVPMTITRDKEYYRDIMRLAPPILIGNLLTFSVGFTDHFMTGELGRDAISGIYLSNQIGMLLQFLIVGVESALAIMGARYHGDGDDDSAARACGVAMISGEIIAILLTFVCIFLPNQVLSLFTSNTKIIDTGAPFLRILAISFPIYTASRVLVAYARSIEHASLSLIAPAVSFSLNLALNLILIYGTPLTPSLGTLGAAIATLAARCLELAISIIYTVRAARQSGIDPSEYLKPQKKIFLSYLRCALPVLGGQGVWAASNFFTSAILGRVDGGAAVAAVGVAISIGNLAYTLMNAASASVGVIISKAVGRGDEKGKITEYAHTSELLFLCIGVIASLAILLLRSPFISLYRLEGADAELASRLILTVAVSFVAICYSAASLFGIIKSGGDVRFAALCELFFLAAVTLPLGTVAYRLGADAATLFIILRIEHFLKCPVAWLKIRRGNWMKRVTEEK